MNYYYGVVSIKVTVAHKKISAVAIGHITEDGNGRSAYIDSVALPILQKAFVKLSSSQQHSMAVKGNNPLLNLVAVSGATYTSAGFDVSLQNALFTLKQQGLF
ncbi:MAG: FMN-binding protein [Acidimicrobiaceae bacterium]|nr:FMN-binding protein [Acidimicrobiaceae bacterium]